MHEEEVCVCEQTGGRLMRLCMIDGYFMKGGEQ